MLRLPYLRHRITYNITGVPMIGVIAFNGRIVSFGSIHRILHRRAITAPIMMVAGSSCLWFSLPHISRAICGVASPIKATGPQKAVEIAVSKPVEQSSKVRTCIMLNPKFCAYSSPNRKALSGFIIARASRSPTTDGIIK